MAFTGYTYAPGLAVLGQAVKDINDRAAKQQELDNEKAAATEIAGILHNSQQPTQTLGQLGPASGATAPAAPSFAGGKTAMQMPADPAIESNFVSNLKAGGLTNPYGLAAMAAYANAESGYNPANITGSWSDPSQSGAPGTSGGILSWRGPRLANMQRMTAGTDDPVAAQTKFALSKTPT